MEWYLKVLRQYADFNGRARRKEYWMFILFNIIFSWGAILLDGLFDLSYGSGGLSGGFINSAYALAMFIPSLAVGVRRLHDVGKSGWMTLIIFIPLAGVIWLIVLFCQDSNYGENEYGLNPKGIGNNDDAINSLTV